MEDMPPDPAQPVTMSASTTASIPRIDIRPVLSQSDSHR